jgi:DNA helicase-2/ATP-dependent DNA helicase PcrA
MKQLDRQFGAVKARLNAAQRKAVETIEGPVLVIAGPGTGKTEILAARIATILQQADVTPESILCLTYTEAGTVAMRSRLLEFIGPDAYRVDIFTFHAFCNLVIQENADQFGFRSLSPVSELEQFQLVREIIDAFSQDNPLTRSTGDIHFEADRLLALYEIMKKEDWSADFLVQQADHYAARLAEDPDYRYKRATKDRDGTLHQKGELNQKKLRDTLRRLAQLKAAACSFPDYQQLLLERGRYDFSDMILWCIKAFEQSPDLLSRYQERYLYLLVDEFQDTSGSQYELLMQLADYWDAPNLFAVGDDDQSIYRFQGASIENIRRFQERYCNDLTVVTLTDNHRSSQQILDAAAGLIGRNSERLTDDKQLKAMNPDVAALPERPELRRYITQAHETVGLAQEIEQLRDKGVPLDRIAVIYRNHSQSDEIIRYLTSRGIPVATRRRADLLREPLIEKLLLVLRYLAAELNRPHSGERLLFELLHEPWFGIAPLSLAQLSLEIGRCNSERRVTSWRAELAASGRAVVQGELFRDPALDALHQAGEIIEELVRNTATMTLQELLHQVITKLGLLATALSSVERVWHLQLLNTLFDFVRDECAKRSMGLSDLLAMLQDMQQQGISLPVEKLSYAGEGVNFLTAHASKGLQFDHVFMLGCTSGAWDGAGRSRTYSLPPAIWTRCSGSEEEESRRLFYVAMTRARKQLVISWPQRDNHDKELEQSRFVAELTQCVDLQPETIVLPDEALLAFGAVTLQVQQRSLPQGLIDTGFVDTLLQKYSLSVTHLNTYLRCPLSFYFNTLLRVPAPMNAAMTFGSAVHYALEQLFRKMLAEPSRQFPSADLFLDDFRWFMRRHEDGFTPSEYKRRLSYGETILPAFHARYQANWHRDVLVEHPYRSIVLDEVPLNGKLDKLELDGSRARVVDYKTGNHKNALKKLRAPDPDKVAKARAEGKQPSPEDLLGGDYWRQAVFYRILLEHDPRRRLTMTAAEFDFIEPDKETGEFHTAVVEVSEEDVAIVKDQIREVYARIRNKEFTQGCGEADCEWCNFVRRFEGR